MTDFTSAKVRRARQPFSRAFRVSCRRLYACQSDPWDPLPEALQEVPFGATDLEHRAPVTEGFMLQYEIDLVVHHSRNRRISGDRMKASRDASTRGKRISRPM